MKKLDLKKLSVEEIKAKVTELQSKLSQLNLGKARTESKDTSVFSKTRKSIARLFTELNMRKG